MVLPRVDPDDSGRDRAKPPAVAAPGADSPDADEDDMLGDRELGLPVLMVDAMDYWWTRRRLSSAIDREVH